MSNHAKISLGHGGIGSVEIDGTDLAHATCGFTIKSPKVGEPITLELDLAVGPLDVELDATVVIPDAVRDALIALGWTPPNDVEFIRCDIYTVLGNCQRPDGHDGPCRVEVPGQTR